MLEHVGSRYTLKDCTESTSRQIRVIVIATLLTSYQIKLFKIK